MARASRQPSSVPPDDSRLGVLGLQASASQFGLLSDWLTDFGPGLGDSRLGDGRPSRPEAGGADAGTRVRIMHSYVAARLMLGLALVVTQAVQQWPAMAHGLPVQAVLALAYLTEGLLAWWLVRDLGRRRPASLRRRLWWLTVGVDLLAFGAMHWLDAPGAMNHVALLVLPVLMAGVLGSRRSALATVAAVDLMLLAAVLLRPTAGEDLTGLLSQAGLVGIGLFVIALVSGQMAARLASQTQTARRHFALALQQAELNRLVIEEMGDGVLVVDRQGGVRAANPAARALLAEGERCPAAPFSLQAQAGWLPLWQVVEAAFEAGHWPAGGVDVSVVFGAEAPRSVRVRGRFTRSGGGVGEGAGQRGETLGVLFMEELRSVLARQRQERLLAMGRISAGVAHEIRNPLAAIAQANALLQEDDLRGDQQRLARIVADNVGRLKRIVDDVMEAAPGTSAPSRVLDLGAEVAAVGSEWARTVDLPLGGDSRLRVRLPAEPVGALFDGDHLRRVLVNLLENARRHAGTTPGAVDLSVEPLGPALVRLAVASDGEPIATEVEAHLFEPFHSTRSRGTGLGLYICRQLCERHGASIDYLRRPGERHANVFQVVMRRAAIDVPGRLHL